MGASGVWKEPGGRGLHTASINMKLRYYVEFGSLGSLWGKSRITPFILPRISRHQGTTSSRHQGTKSFALIEGDRTSRRL